MTTLERIQAEIDERVDILPDHLRTLVRAPNLAQRYAAYKAVEVLVNEVMDLLKRRDGLAAMRNRRDT